MCQLHISLTRTAQIYLELHFCVELHTKKSHAGVMCDNCTDQTAKIWDLTAGVETRSLGIHPASVVSVKYSHTSQLVYTASAYLVMVWDPRRSACVHTLTLVCC